MSRTELLNKIKGGWAGQTIGVTFGSYTEFKHNGTFIQNYQQIPWRAGYVKETMSGWPDLYDDIYMDLTFVEVLERAGMKAPVDSFAFAFANAGYNLWHANQAARYNILHGVKNSGHWKNNPHADDIDYQIEADYAGLMNPGMPNSASGISDKIGHIMNYGDGWYGGVYFGAMYSLAFVSDNVEYVVSEALKTIPVESKFYKCISDVIKWHKAYPGDWHQTWLEIQKKHSEDVGCPDGVFSPFDIDATINASYVVLGLLYGDGNFTKTLEISTRAGQDSDCNPSTAGGILGTMLGYNKIPGYWMKGLEGSEDMEFKYTSLSLNEVYEMSNRHALSMIESNGGKVNAQNVQIQLQTPQTVRLEQCFEGSYPVSRVNLSNPDIKELTFEFEGTGFVLRGEAAKRTVDGSIDLRDTRFELKEARRKGINTFNSEISATLYIDGKKVETAFFPTNFRYRRHDLFWQYELPKGRHSVKVEVNGDTSDCLLRSWDYIVYSDQPNNSIHPE